MCAYIGLTYFEVFCRLLQQFLAALLWRLPIHQAQARHIGVSSHLKFRVCSHFCTLPDSQANIWNAAKLPAMGGCCSQSTIPRHTASRILRPRIGKQPLHDQMCALAAKHCKVRVAEQSDNSPFYSILFISILFYSVLSYPILPYSILYYSILGRSQCSTIFY